MKRILVVTSDVPFVDGGHRAIARGLRDALIDAGHSAEIWSVPQNRFGRQLRAYLAARLTDLELTGDDQPVDGIISLKYPSYAVCHPRHVCWLVHRMREYYDLWGEFKSRLSWKGRIKESVRRQAIHALDRRYLKGKVKRLFAISTTVGARLERWGGLESTVLHPPPPDRAYRSGRYEPILFAYSRLDRLKRFDLLLRAFSQSSGALALRIGGEGSEMVRLKKLTGELGLEGKVTFLGRLDENELLEELSRCRAVYFAPLNEDLGFVTLEAFRSARPVITATDSGGPLEFVIDEETGLVAEPKPVALAGAIDRLARDETLAARMGVAGRESIAGLTWQRTAETLVSALGD